MAETYPHPKMNLRQWIANFWYYYKWFFLLGVMIFIFVVIASVQLFSKSTPDASLLYVGPRSISDRRCGEIISVSQEVMHADYNGDGKKKITLKTVTLSTDYQALIDQPGGNQTEFEAYLDYHNEIVGGDACILLLDPYFFQELADDGALMTLYEIFGDEAPEAGNDYGIRLDSLPLYSQQGFSALPPDTMLCMRYASQYAQQEAADRYRLEEESIAVFLDLYSCPALDSNA